MRPPISARRAGRLAAEAAAPIKVLVVDDMEPNLVAMRGLLADPGLDVLAATSGAQALELLLQHDVAVALLDVQMPGMDGYALAELMRGSERTRAVPIMFLTAGNPEQRASFRGYEAGAVDFLYKPIDERVLRSKVAVFAELHRQRRALGEHAARQARFAHQQALVVATLSHDLLEPLTALALNAQLQLQRAVTPAQRQAAARQKAATALLQRQVHHLISLAQAPTGEIAPYPRATDLARLARECWQRHAEHLPPEVAGEFSAGGETVGWWDADLLAEAFEQLLLQAQTYAGDTAVHLHIDGSAHGVVTATVCFDQALSDAAALHLLGGGMPLQPASAGAGLHDVNRIARAHGGSLIGRSGARDGTRLELTLPRGTAG